MGLLLPVLARRPSSARVTIMAVLFAVPMTTHMLVLASEGRYDPRPPFAATGLAVRERLGVADEPALDAFAHGGPGNYLAWNVSVAMARPGTYLQSGRPAKVLALFLLGAWLGASVLPRMSRLRASLLVAVVVGGVVGLSASYDYAAIKAETGSTFLLSNLGLTQTVAYTLGTTPLAIAVRLSDTDDDSTGRLLWIRPGARRPCATRLAPRGGRGDPRHPALPLPEVAARPRAWSC
jgi:uncharacterized protein